ncbi:MAG: translocation/assembly module TamB domain-containing protein, partial [Deltaproteobacteria bacterium]|nr:translocation/assembly module TamB domain-containing protein [Deltaproteobacteria bacterium]
VAILDPDGKPVAIAARLRAVLQVGALAERTLRITRVDVVGLKLNLEADDRGVNIARAFKSTSAVTAGGDEETFRLVIDRFVTEPADVLFRSGEVSVAIAELVVDGGLSLEGGRFRASSPVRASRVAVQIGQVALRADRVSSASVVVDERGLETAPLKFQIGGAESRIGGTIVWAKPDRYDMQGDLSLAAGYWPDGLDRPDVKIGAVGAGFRMSGPLARPLVDLDLRPAGVEVSGIGLSEVAGELRLDVDGISAQTLRARLAGGKLQGQGKVTWDKLGLDGKLKAAALRVEQLARTDAITGLIDGDLEFAGALKEPLAIALKFRGTTRRLRTAEIALDEPYKLWLTGRLLRDRLELDRGTLGGPALWTLAKGPIRFQARTLELRLHTHVKQPSAVLGAYLRGVSSSLIHLEGAASGRFDRVSVKVDLQADLAELGPIAASAISAHLSVDRERLVVDQLRGLVAGGALEGGLRAGLGERGDLRGHALVTAAHLAELRGLGGDLGGQIDVSVEASGTVQHPDVLFRVDGRGIGYGGAGPYRLQGAGTWRERQVRLDQVALAQQRAEGEDEPLLVGQAGIDLERETLAGELELHPVMVASLPYAARARLGGSASGRLTIAGTLEQPALQAEVRLEDVNAAGSPLGSGSAVACYGGGELWAGVRLGAGGEVLACQRSVFEDSRARLAAQLQYRPADAAMAAQFRGRELSLASLAAHWSELRGLDGAVQLDGAVTGPIDRLSGHAVARADSVALDGKPLGGASAVVDLDVGSATFALEVLDQIRCRGTYTVYRGQVFADARLVLADFSPDLFSVTLRERGANVRLDGAVQLDYDPQRPEKLVASARVEGATVEIAPAKPLRLVAPAEIRVVDKSVTIERATFESGGSRLTVGGSYRPTELAFDLDGELALAMLRLLSSEISGADGACLVKLAVRGAPNQPSLRGTIEPRPGASISPRALGRPIELASGRITFSDQEVRAELVHAYGLGGEAWLTGQVALERGAVKDYDVAARIENMQLRLDRLRVEVNSELALVGPSEQPRLSGTIDVVEGRFFERYQLRNFIATALTSERSRPLAELIPSLAATELDLKVTGGDLRARADMGTLMVDLVGDADLRLGGSLRDASLSGVVDVNEGNVSLLGNRLQVETASIDFPVRPDRRLVPNLDLRARSLIEPAVSPTGAELPIVLSLRGDVERMQLDVEAEDSSQQLSRVDLISLLATGRSAQALLGASGGDAAARAVSREVFGDFERLVETSLDGLVGDTGDRPFDFTLESGASSARTSLRWDVSQRITVEGETALAFRDLEDPSIGDAPVSAGTMVYAVRARVLLADHLPIAESVALEFDFANLSVDPNVYSNVDLKLKFRIFDL